MHVFHVFHPPPKIISGYIMCIVFSSVQIV
jgi:hypothetical protein